MAIERIIGNCGESRSTAMLSMAPVAEGAAGPGIYVFTGQGRLPYRGFKEMVDIINQKAITSLLALGHCKSFAIPANEEYHMPITLYVGREALLELQQEIDEGKYEYFRDIWSRSKPSSIVSMTGDEFTVTI